MAQQEKIASRFQVKAIADDRSFPYVIVEVEESPHNRWEVRSPEGDTMWDLDDPDGAFSTLVDDFRGVDGHYIDEDDRLV